ncbi:glycosyltransferase family 8 protein [Psittacicella hinzii]|uniref:Uncharacterized protein n=1 Tax=Psittacicella hinzii TaxID=2028575 RepID=A0A3A1YNQ5_9GAMM|nr:glycosyltransferase [Psittacicella hinzii]RIY39315.1 hypothetical protein CKF58_02420 [Psittacicella hinzii]
MFNSPHIPFNEYELITTSEPFSPELSAYQHIESYICPIEQQIIEQIQGSEDSTANTNPNICHVGFVCSHSYLDLLEQSVISIIDNRIDNLDTPIHLYFLIDDSLTLADFTPLSKYMKQDAAVSYNIVNIQGSLDCVTSHITSHAERIAYFQKHLAQQLEQSNPLWVQHNQNLQSLMHEKQAEQSNATTTNSSKGKRKTKSKSKSKASTQAKQQTFTKAISASSTYQSTGQTIADPAVLAWLETNFAQLYQTYDPAKIVYRHQHDYELLQHAILKLQRQNFEAYEPIKLIRLLVPEVIHSISPHADFILLADADVLFLYDITKIFETSLERAISVTTDPSLVPCNSSSAPIHTAEDTRSAAELAALNAQAQEHFTFFKSPHYVLPGITGFRLSILKPYFSDLTILLQQGLRNYLYGAAVDPVAEYLSLLMIALGANIFHPDLNMVRWHQGYYFERGAKGVNVYRRNRDEYAPVLALHYAGKDAKRVTDPQLGEVYRPGIIYQVKREYFLAKVPQTQDVQFVADMLVHNKRLLEENPVEPQITTHLVFCSNQDYLTALNTCLESLYFYRKPHNKYIVHLFYRDIEQADLEQLQQRAAWSNCEIRPFNMQEYLSKYPDLTTKQYFTIDIYSRLFIPDIFAQYYPEVEQVTYLDVDLLIQHDLGDTAVANLGDKIFGATPDIDLYARLQDDWPVDHDIDDKRSYFLRFTNANPQTIYDIEYFNSGVIIWNLRRWRELELPQFHLLEQMRQHMSFAFPDQDMLNLFAKQHGGYFRLHQGLNNLRGPVEDAQLRLFKPNYTTYPERCPLYIMHYTGPQKPWNNPFIATAEWHLFFWRLSLRMKDIITGKDLTIPSKNDKAYVPFTQRTVAVYH